MAKVVAEQLPFAEARQIDLGVTPAARPVSVSGDAEALHILVSNLVGNAVRYTPPGGKVDVAVGDDAECACVEVKDSGPGIPVEERARVFDRFYRRAHTDEPGSGLGLAIVRTIAERHQASVLLDEADLGGLRARVRFAGAAAC